MFLLINYFLKRDSDLIDRRLYVGIRGIIISLTDNDYIGFFIYFNKRCHRDE